MTPSLASDLLKPSLSHDLDSIRAIGHGAIALLNTCILLAIVAVIVSKRSTTPQILTGFFNLLSWLVGQVVRPIQAGTDVPLTTTLTDANSLSQGSSGSNASGSSGANASSAFPTGGTSTGGDTPPVDDIPTMTISPG